MKDLRIYFIFCLFLISLKGLAQEKKYFGQTEIGMSVGRSEELWDGNREKRRDFTLQSFHGAKISKSHVVGFSVGFDRYDHLSIIPFAFGYRGFLGDEGKSRLFGGLDLGIGSTILEKKTRDEWSKSWYQGGLLFSPSIGVSFPSRKGSSALSLSVAYKRQELSFFQGTLDRSGSQAPASKKLPPGFSSLSETESLYQRMVFCIGLIY
ncbi:hypothetical protein JYB64_12610 [Algoriphagus aestuarii]|nr:hypothetical protein [Algoriphagus aestuarii]